MSDVGASAYHAVDDGAGADVANGGGGIAHGGNAGGGKERWCECICRAERNWSKHYVTLVEDAQGTLDGGEKLADNLKNMMGTFSLIGALLVTLVFSVNGPTLEVHQESVWGDYRETAKVCYGVISAFTAVMCVLTVGTCVRVILLITLCPASRRARLARDLGGFLMMSTPYGAFAIIYILLGVLITLQGTLIYPVYGGVASVFVVWVPSAIALLSWVWADMTFTRVTN